MTKKNLVIAAAVLAAGSAVYVGATRRSATHAGGSPAAAPEAREATSAAAPTALPRERNFKSGASFTYDVTRDFAMTGAASAPSIQSSIAGSLELTVVGAEDDGAAIRGELRKATRKDTPARDVKDPAEGLATPFFFVLRPNGAIASMHFPKSIPGESRRNLRAIVSSLQIARGDAAGAAWEIGETDESGQYVARYEASGDALVKKKLRYELVRSPQGLVPVSTIGSYEPSGATTIAVDASGWPGAVDEDATIVASFQGGQLTLRTRTKARLVATGEAKQYVGSFEVAEATFDPDTDGIADDAALAQKNADLGLVGGATLASLVADYASDAGAKGRRRAVARMGALFRTSPEAVRDARAKLLAKDTDEATRRALASALGGAGSKEAQGALADALRSPDVPSSAKSTAAISLGLVEQPTPAAKSALRDASKSNDPDVAQTATLAMGNLAKSGAEAGQDTGDLVDDLVAKLKAATTASDKALYLDALGNTGDARAFGPIQAFLGDADPFVRAAAVGALRFQNDASVPAILAAAVEDADATVRRAALSAISVRDVVPVLPALDHVLKNDGDKGLRMQAVRILARWVDTVPDASQMLLWVASHDPDPEVKEAATAALSTPAAKQGPR